MALPEVMCWTPGASGKPHGDLFLEIQGAGEKRTVRFVKVPQTVPYSVKRQVRAAGKPLIYEGAEFYLEIHVKDGAYPQVEAPAYIEAMVERSRSPKT